MFLQSLRRSFLAMLQDGLPKGHVHQYELAKVQAACEEQPILQVALKVFASPDVRSQILTAQSR